MFLHNYCITLTKASHKSGVNVSIQSSENRPPQFGVNLMPVTCTAAPAQSFHETRRPIGVLITTFSDSLSFSAERTATAIRKGGLPSPSVNSHISRTTSAPLCSGSEQGNTSKLDEQNDRSERLKQCFAGGQCLRHDSLRDPFQFSAFLSSFNHILALSLWNLHVVSLWPSVDWFIILCMSETRLRLLIHYGEIFICMPGGCNSPVLTRFHFLRIRLFSCI